MREPIDLTRCTIHHLQLGGIIPETYENPMKKIVKIGLLVGFVTLGFTIIYISNKKADGEE
ncbi:hypothetical protein [Sediminibacterium sp.]|uniref:hypothetical protein n=1 Tax=Sediminibacterium sp. TaxID=1917865 RepID=UPI003F6FFDFA